MPVFAFTAGSLGDILATVGLTAQVAQALYDNKNMAKECETLGIELRSLQQVLLLTEFALKRHESTPLGEPLAYFIWPEVAQCHLSLKQFSEKIDNCRHALSSTTISSLWRRVVWAASDEAVSLSTKLSSHRLKLALLLVSLNSVGFLDPGQSHITEAQLNKHCCSSSIHKMRNNTIDVVDPLGDTIPISTLFCASWESFHYVIRGYCVDRIGQDYVERGDYQIVQPGSEGDQMIDRFNFSRVVKEGDFLEMSIILRTKSTGTVCKEGDKKCPRCSRSNAHASSDGGWMRCSRCSCRHNVRHAPKEGHGVVVTKQEQDVNTLSPSDSSTEATKPAKNEISDVRYFRRITLEFITMCEYSVTGHPPCPSSSSTHSSPDPTQHHPHSQNRSSASSTHGPRDTHKPTLIDPITAHNNYPQRLNKIGTLSWSESCVVAGPHSDRTWTVHCKVDGEVKGCGTSGFRHKAKDIAAEQALKALEIVL